MRLSWLLPWFLPWLTLVGMAPVFVAEGADDPSSSIPPEGVWQGVEFWVGDSADEPSVHWPGAMMTLIGHGPEGDVQRLAEAIADRVALFDAVAGLQEPAQRHVEARHHTGHEHDRLRLDRPAVRVGEIGLHGVFDLGAAFGP